jgi:hypothetical protein
MQPHIDCAPRALREETMKKLPKLVVLSAVLALSVAAVAQAEVVQNVQVPVVGSVLVPCANGGAGEMVDFSGVIHIVVSVTINGNNVSGKTHFQPQGLKGVGQITGDSYNAVGVTQESIKGSLQNGQFTGTFVNNFRLIGPGPGNNLQIHENAHITINANGDVTAFIDNFGTDCK